MRIKRILIPVLALSVAMLPAMVRAQFLFVTTNNVVTITGYTGSNGVVVVPKKIAGLPVGIIGTSAFASLTNLASVTLPDTVTKISDQAFYNCAGLTNITLGNSVTFIGNYAFEYCSNLSNVTIPAGVNNLGSYAFAYCQDLVGAYFQGNALTTWSSQFAYDPQAVVYFLPWTTGWSTIYGGAPTAPYVPPVPFKFSTNNGSITITAYTDSNGVAIVPAKIYVPGATNFLPVTSIGALAACPGLSNIFIPDTVTDLWFDAFASCSNLVGAFFAGNNPWHGSGIGFDDRNFSVYYTPGTTGWSSFFAAVPPVQLPYTYTITNGAIVITSYAGSNGTVSVPGMIGGLPVTSIGAGAFAFCGNLTNVTIPSSVTDIGNGAFAFCGGLTSFTMPDSVTDFGIFTFYACSNLAEVTLSTNIQNIGVSAFDSCTSLTNVEIPDGVFIIGASAFQNCAALTGAAVPACVASIGPDAFGVCGSLRAINVDPQNANYSSVDGILFNGNQTSLIQCPGGKVGNYTIPGTVGSIGNDAFQSCARLTSVAIPASVSSIGDWAFESCSGLTNLDWATPNQFNSTLGSYVFASCSSLKRVVIPNNFGIYGSYHWFDGCTSLTEATIGFNLISTPSNIGLTMFSDCPNLTSIFLMGLMQGGQGSSPHFAWNPTNAVATPTAYYLPGSATNYITGLPTALWLPRILTADGSFGFQTNQFGFNIAWASAWTVEVDASTNLTQAAWSPVTNLVISVSNGLTYFSDPQWTNYPGRFYRILGLNVSQ